MSSEKVVDATIVRVQKFVRFDSTGETLSRLNPFDIGNHRIYSVGHQGRRFIYFLERGGPTPSRPTRIPPSSGTRISVRSPREEKGDARTVTMEFRTVQGSSIKLLVESLKELTNDVNVFFDQSGVRIVSFDMSHCALFHAFMDADKIEEYRCNKQYTVGISLVNLFKLIKNVSVNDEMELRLRDEALDVMTSRSRTA
eukprot:jgi/Mesvir1/4219/Mv22633-RA.1